MERPSRMAFEPLANIGMLMGCVVVDDGVDRLSNGNLLLDDIEEANESGKKLGVRRLGDAGCRWSNSSEPVAADRNGAPGRR